LDLLEERLYSYVLSLFLSHLTFNHKFSNNFDELFMCDFLTITYKKKKICTSMYKFSNKYELRN